jgi:flavodoxin
MNAVVVYDTQFGNTEQVARAIATELEKQGTVRLMLVDDATGVDLTGVDLLVIGGPTQAHGARPSLRTWVRGLPPASLPGISTATFDTRLRWPEFLAGSAARSIAKMLRHDGARLVVPPESFLVSGSEGPLMSGELERAGSWAATVAAEAGARAVAVR